MLKPNEVVIHAGNWQQFITPVVDGEQKAHGLMPRDWQRHPCGSMPGAPLSTVQKIPRSEWPERIRDLVGRKALLSDIRDIGMGGQRIPSRDQNGRGYCLPPGTLIRMADGSQKPIEEVKLLDEVLTAEGNIGRVMQCHVRDYDGELLEIKTFGHGHLRCTANHRVLTKRGYVRADELVHDDWVCVPRYAAQKSSVLITSNYLSRSRALVSAGSSGIAEPELVPDLISLNYGLGRIFGLWLAEGVAEPGRLTWCFGTEKKMHLVNELCELLRAELGMDARIQQKGETVTLVRMRGKAWSELFVALLGKLANGKFVSPDLMSGPREFLEGLFAGWMDADGCHRGHRGKAYRCGATVSHRLALNMYDIANFLGYTPSIGRERPQQNRYAKNRLPVWKIQINPEPSTRRQNFRLLSEDCRVWRKVRNLVAVSIPYTGKVYNIGVEGDNSYVAEGVSVHNCWAHSTVSAALLRRAKDGQPYADLSAYAIACIIKGYQDEGGWNGESMQFLRERGCPSSEFWAQQSTSRSNDKPETWENAAKYKMTDWEDVPDRDFDTLMTHLLLCEPCPIDENWWSHSICACDPVDGATTFGVMRAESGKLVTHVEFDEIWEINKFGAAFGARIWNSWGDSWSEAGMGILTESKATPDGSIALVGMRGSA